MRDSEINKGLNLIATHATTEDKLARALLLEGLPGLSTAVININDGLANEGYGEISLVFDKSTIDPKRKGNAIVKGTIVKGTVPNGSKLSTN